jgi:hypothetical protein
VHWLFTFQRRWLIFSNFRVEWMKGSYRIAPFQDQKTINTSKERITMKKIMFGAAILGLCVSINAQSLLTTMGSTAGNVWGISSGSFSVAQQFTTGSQDADIGSVLLSISTSQAGAAFTVGFYSNASGQPGSLVANGLLSGPSVPAANDINTYTASGLNLSANTTYWLVLDNTSASYVGVRNRQGQPLVSSSSDGWTLGNLGYKSETSTGSYSMVYTGIAEPLFSIVAPVPEPSTLALAGMGGLGLMWHLRRRK